MNKLNQEQIARRDKASGLIILVLFIVVAVLSAVRVYAANRLVETSEELRSLDLEVTKLETENQDLAVQVRGFEAMSSVEDKVNNLGFVKNNSFAYLSPAPEVALLR